MKKIFKRKNILFVVLILIILVGQQTYYSDIPIEYLKEKYTNKHSKFIEVNNMQVHYRDEGAGTPIVLIHGTASSLHTWNDWAKNLTKNYRVIRMDLPAFGLTGANSNGDYSIKNYTSFLNQFLSKLNINGFYLAGNSLGGNIAWDYAANYPEKVKKLILIGASGLHTNKSQPWIFKMAKTPVLNSLFLYFTPKAIVRDNIKQVYQDDTKITDKLVTRYHDMALREGNRQAFIDRAKIDFTLNEKGNFEKLKSIKTETLLLWGENDLWIPLNNGKQMDSLMHNSKLVVLKNSGHVPMEENPEESLKVFYEFINN